MIILIEKNKNRSKLVFYHSSYSALSAIIVVYHSSNYNTRESSSFTVYTYVSTKLNFFK